MLSHIFLCQLLDSDAFSTHPLFKVGLWIRPAQGGRHLWLCGKTRQATGGDNFFYCQFFYQFWFSIVKFGKIRNMIVQLGVAGLDLKVGQKYTVKVELVAKKVLFSFLVLHFEKVGVGCWHKWVPNLQDNPFGSLPKFLGVKLSENYTAADSRAQGAFQVWKINGSLIHRLTGELLGDAIASKNGEDCEERHLHCRQARRSHCLEFTGAALVKPRQMVVRWFFPH